MIATKDQKNQYPAYASNQSDDGKNQRTNIQHAYAAKYSDDGERPSALNQEHIIWAPSKEKISDSNHKLKKIDFHLICPAKKVEVFTF